MRSGPTMLALALALAGVACGGGGGGAVPVEPVSEPVVAGAPFPPVPPDAAPADAWPEVAPEPAPEPEPPVGALPVPEPGTGEWFNQPPTIDELDTTIAAGDLPRPAGKWKRRAAVGKGGGELWLALHVITYGSGIGDIMLSVVENGTGVHEQFKLGATDEPINNHTFDGSAFPSWTARLDTDVEYTGPLVFSARITPRGKTVKHQYVVYRDGASVMVVERRLGASAWSRRLRLDFKPGTTFTGIGTTDPH